MMMMMMTRTSPVVIQEESDSNLRYCTLAMQEHQLKTVLVRDFSR